MMFPRRADPGQETLNGALGRGEAATAGRFEVPHFFKQIANGLGELLPRPFFRQKRCLNGKTLFQNSVGLRPFAFRDWDSLRKKGTFPTQEVPTQVVRSANSFSGFRKDRRKLDK